MSRKRFKVPKKEYYEYLDIKHKFVSIQILKFINTSYMDNDIISLALIFGLLPLIVLTIFILTQRTKHKERMALIEKGLGEPLLSKKESPFQDVLMWGLLSAGVGFGLFIGYILLAFPFFKDDMILGIMSILFGGLGLIIYYFHKRKAKNKGSE